MPHCRDARSATHVSLGLSMATLTVPTSTPAQARNRSEKDICEISKRVVAYSQPQWDRHERRWFKRYAYPVLIELTPIADDSAVPIDDTIVVVGRQLSLMGLDFYHHDPLPYRRAVVSLEHGKDQWVHYVIALAWCRFIRPNWYSSGGRFTDMLDDFSRDRLA